ncbi:hypothetical protein B9479_004075 [Cryptococcus floricola]|uniref:Uncharacterized protein n=1 Tax=Cryptococcus floricola TaxID=2591691 RepID=A0A5D3AV40_9TREE|nr:hypothetical protein B9479_004075 [Cryptococcus floricola]
MGYTTIPPNLIALLASPQTPTSYATDALEEWILHRRAKGDTLFETSVGLVELEDRTPPHLTYAFDRARYLTNVPHISDLSPPTGPFPLSRSASTSTILAHLLSSPPPTIQHSREVILEYTLARETKLREKKSGRAGKGTLGREAFEDIAKRMGEIEDGLRQNSSDSPRRGSVPLRDAYPSPQSSQGIPELSENQQIGLTLILSLRMSLSYFTLQELADQLLKLALGDAERMLVQHIRRRVPGEGRWGVGKELEFVEGLTLIRRPALRPAFRSAKARTLLPPKAIYPVSLPAPSKSQCIKHIQALVKEVDTSGPDAAAASLQSHAPAGVAIGSPGFAVKRAMGSPAPAFSREGTPVTSLALPPVQFPTARRTESDPNIISNYVHELISEFIAREKRDHMLKSKWSKTGRAQLSKDLGDIESALCLASKNAASPLAPTLIPTFLILRRTFFLPPSPLPQSITEPYLDILPAPPDADDVAFREPTVSSTTAALYVNPRLDDERAYEVMEELVEFEKEKVEGAGGSEESMVGWAMEQLEAVQKRFPDGSYAATFARVKQSLVKPPSPVSSTSIAFAPSPTSSVHRRTRSHAFPDAQYSANTGSPVAVGVLKAQHTRSWSMPSRKGTYDEENEEEANVSYQQAAQVPTPETQSAESSPPRVGSIVTELPQLPPLVITPLQMDARRASGVSTVPTSAGGSTGGGWWDVISAVGKEDRSGSPAPWEQGSDKRSTGMTHSSSGYLSISGSVGAPGLRESSSHGSLALGNRTSIEAPLPPGAEAARLSGAPAVPDFTRPMMSLDLNSPESSPKSISPPSKTEKGLYASQNEDVRASPGIPHALSSPPRVGHPSYDQDRERLPPPPPLRFDQPRGTTLGSSSNLSSPSMSSATPTPTGMQAPRLSPAPFYPTSRGTSPGLTPTTASGPSPPAPSGSSIAFAHPPDVPKSSPSPPTPSTTPPVKASKLGTFGRTMSLARSKSKKEKAEKEKEKEKERVMNDPKRWNRSAVQNIMGPPAR